MTDTYLCNFCGEDHEVGPEPPPNSWSGGPLRTCPSIPVDHVYLHDEPEGKPNGMLVKIREPRAPAFKVDFPDGEPVRFRVLTGSDEDARLTAAKEQALRELRGRRRFWGRSHVDEVKRLGDKINRQLQQEREGEA